MTPRFNLHIRLSTVAILTALVLSAWAGLMVTRHVITAIDAIRDASVGASVQTLNKASVAADNLNQTALAATATLNQATKTLAEGQTTVLQMQPLLVQATATAETLNRNCDPGRPCGTLADVAKTLNTVRGTFGQIEVAANHENKNLTTLDTQEATLFNDFHTTLLSGNDSVELLNTRLSDPRIDHLMGKLDSTMGHVDGIVADGQIKAHKVLNPDKVKLTIWTGSEATLDWVHSHIIPPLF